MRIDFHASQPHYVDHLLPVWNALPEWTRGEFFTDGFPGPVAEPSRFMEGECLVAGASRDLNGVNYRRRVLVEHGIGQSYSDNPEHPAYSGGRTRDQLSLVLAPNHRTANRHPEGVAVGSPKLDPWHAGKRGVSVRRERPVVACSFHWSCPVSPESGSAFLHFSSVLEKLRNGPWDLIGHAHPRDEASDGGRVRHRWQELGVRFEPNFATILDDADIYICDNSSTLYEFASTGRPVVVLNDPSWRKDVDHGFRFWEYADVGPQVNDPEQINRAVTLAIVDSAEYGRRREFVSRQLYVVRDGSASKHAALSILKMLGCGMLPG